MRVSATMGGKKMREGELYHDLEAAYFLFLRNPGAKEVLQDNREIFEECADLLFALSWAIDPINECEELNLKFDWPELSELVLENGEPHGVAHPLLDIMECGCLLVDLLRQHIQMPSERNTVSSPVPFLVDKGTQIALPG